VKKQQIYPAILLLLLLAILSSCTTTRLPEVQQKFKRFDILIPVDTSIITYYCPICGRMLCYQLNKNPELSIDKARLYSDFVDKVEDYKRKHNWQLVFRIFTPKQDPTRIKENEDEEIADVENEDGSFSGSFSFPASIIADGAWTFIEGFAQIVSKDEELLEILKELEKSDLALYRALIKWFISLDSKINLPSESLAGFPKDAFDYRKNSEKRNEGFLAIETRLKKEGNVEMLVLVKGIKKRSELIVKLKQIFKNKQTVSSEAYQSWRKEVFHFSALSENE